MILHHHHKPTNQKKSHLPMLSNSHFNTYSLNRTVEWYSALHWFYMNGLYFWSFPGEKKKKHTPQKTQTNHNCKGCSQWEPEILIFTQALNNYFSVFFLAILLLSFHCCRRAKSLSSWCQKLVGFGQGHLPLAYVFAYSFISIRMKKSIGCVEGMCLLL